MKRHPLPWHLGWGRLCGRSVGGWFPCRICRQSHRLRQLQADLEILFVMSGKDRT